MTLVATTLPGLGQSQNRPQLFEPGVISTGLEAAITFTREGKILYFARRDDRQHPAHICQSRLVAGVWQTPEVALSGGDAWFDFDPCIGPDGKHIFLASNRSAEGIVTVKVSATVKASMHIWVADHQGSEWSSPWLVVNRNPESKDGTPAVARDQRPYFVSDRQAEPNKSQTRG